MKTLIATLALLMALSAPAQAEQASCEQIAELAKSIITARQQGVSVVKMMGLSGDRDLVEMIVVDAYDSHRYITNEAKARKASNFRDKWFLACYKERKD
jgi:isopentenyl diphosphate isomerase/L-lactate dehydrogenase-like FMN-dependent dehydrogenase